MNNIEKIIDKVDELIVLSISKYNITLPNIDIKFDLKGRSAGQARVKRSIFGNEYTIRFNIDMVNDHRFDHIYNQVVSHELAHIIGFYTGWFKNHDRKWKSVCIALGGNGERCHDQEVTYARNVKQYKYNTTCGKVITVSAIRHNKIQKGKVYKLASTGGYLIKESFKLA